MKSLSFFLLMAHIAVLSLTLSESLSWPGFSIVQVEECVRGEDSWPPHKIDKVLVMNLSGLKLMVYHYLWGLKS